MNLATPREEGLWHTKWPRGRGGSVKAILMAIGLLMAPSMALSPAADMPDGCAQEGTAFACEWIFDTRSADGATAPSRDYEFPAFRLTLATVTVRLEGEDRGWRVILRDINASSIRTASESRHAAPHDASTYHVDTSTHVLNMTGETHVLRLVTNHADLPNGNFVSGLDAASLGTFTIIYRGEAIPPGQPPERPAASREHPHVMDTAGDARRPELDVTAAWLDDARLGDGLIEAHLAVVNLSNIRWDMATVSVLSADTIAWRLHFQVGSDAYYVRWTLGNLADTANMTCRLFRVQAPVETVVSNPLCTIDEDHGTFSATFPESSLDNPARGEHFEHIRADVVSLTTFAAHMEDEATQTQFDFAIGGPVVWDDLNGCVFCPPVAMALPWYQDPLASDNLPNSLQVLGAAVAVASFVGGFFLLRRNRRQTQRLIDRVDHLVEKHESNAREGLHELGRLEIEMTKLYRAGKINDAQYQIASQRIVAAASRLALRRELGLEESTTLR